MHILSHQFGFVSKFALEIINGAFRFLPNATADVCLLRHFRNILGITREDAHNVL